LKIYVPKLSKKKIERKEKNPLQEFKEPEKSKF